jgi:hypothetical protein
MIFDNNDSHPFQNNTNTIQSYDPSLQDTQPPHHSIDRFNVMGEFSPQYDRVDQTIHDSSYFSTGGFSAGDISNEHLKTHLYDEHYTFHSDEISSIIASVGSREADRWTNNPEDSPAEQLAKAQANNYEHESMRQEAEQEERQRQLDEEQRQEEIRHREEQHQEEIRREETLHEQQQREIEQQQREEQKRAM